MPFDAFTLKHTIKEMQFFVGGKINKINQPSKEEVIFSVYANGKTQKLILSTHAQNARIGITTQEKENPSVAPNFCMLLRKHILGGEILSISQVEFERVIILELNCKNDLFERFKKQIIIEIMGKYSNIVLVQDGIILGALKTANLEVNSLRPIFAGLKYSLPKKQDKINPYDKQNALEYLKNYTTQNLSDFLFSGFSGIADFTAKEIATRISFTTPEDFYNKFIDFLDCVQLSPSVIYSTYKDFTIYTPTCWNGEIKKFDTILQASSYLFDKKETEKSISQKRDSLTSKINFYIKKIVKKMQTANSTLEQGANNEENMQKGQLILANIYKIKKGDKKLVCENFYIDTLPTVIIPLDEKLSPQANANRFFKKYNKVKTAQTYAEQSLAECQKELDYLNSILSEIKICETLADLKEVEQEMAEAKLTNVKVEKRNKKAVKFRTYEYLGITIFIGKNNIQNESLRQNSHGADLWFHTKNYHSSFVVAKYNGQPFSDKVIEFCSELCAYYSECKTADKVEVDYTQIKYVKRPPSSHVGKVIYTNHSSILATPNSHKEYEK